MKIDMEGLRSRAKPSRQTANDVDSVVGFAAPSSSLSQERTKKSNDVLGFRHWVLILMSIAAIYATVVIQDKRMPDPVPSTELDIFSEERARWLLNNLTRLGPRPSGSKACEVGAVGAITKRLEQVKSEVELRGVNRFETDVQYPSARIGPKKAPEHAILVNCHFDTLPDCPGATDDAVSCAIMMEILDVLSRSTVPLENDIVFLFNGAEENFLQASHGFITQHPWRHYIRAFVNLEGAGAGGREILFQAGPQNSWLLKTYLENVPYPHCSVFAQEIFQAGIVPSDTDFRVFRDYGRISGLDIAYFHNGWVYHTEFDTAAFIGRGSIQRAGENILALTKALVKSPNLESPSFDTEQFVFYDVIGLFVVFYTVAVGVVLNYTTVVLVFLLVAMRIHLRVYSVSDLLKAFKHHAIAAGVMLAVGFLIVLVITKMDLVMCWYSLPELVFPLYMFPMLVVGISVHNIFAHRSKMRNAEMVHYDSVLLILATMLAFATFSGFASAFFLLIHTFFPLMRDPVLFLLNKLGIMRRLTVQWLLGVQLLCSLPVMMFGGYAVMLLFEFFVPVAGRLGNAINPDIVVMLVAFVTATSFLLYTNNLMCVSRRLDYLIKCGIAVFVFFFIILATTRIGWPYKYSETAPRLRRMIALDAKRTIYSFVSNETTVDNGLFLQAFDYRGSEDFPEHAFLSGNPKGRPNCTNIADEYCRLPYYTAIHELFPPEQSRWMPLPNVPHIPNPLQLELVSKTVVNEAEVRYEFVLRGGTDKTSLHLTPLNGLTLKQWSFTDMDIQAFGRRRTYFVFMSYGHEAPTERRFWILLDDKSKSVDLASSKLPLLEVSVATHYAHGPDQNSDALLQLRSLMNGRRLQPHASIGHWRWASTIIGGVSEIIVRMF